MFDPNPPINAISCRNWPLFRKSLKFFLGGGGGDSVSVIMKSKQIWIDIEWNVMKRVTGIQFAAVVRFFGTRPFQETVESTWLKRLNVKRIESKISVQGQNFTCTNSSTIWASNSSCSSTARGQKLQRNLEARHILWHLEGQVRQKCYTWTKLLFLICHLSYFMFSFARSSWESYPGYAALASPAFPTRTILEDFQQNDCNMRSSWNMVFRS